MARDRANMGFGPSALPTLTNSATSIKNVGAGAWVQWGPFKATNFVSQAIFSGTSAGQRVKVQATLTTVSTGGTVSFAVMKSSIKAQQTSTASGTYSYVRAYSSVLSAGKSVTVYIAAVN